MMRTAARTLAIAAALCLPLATIASADTARNVHPGPQAEPPGPPAPVPPRLEPDERGRRAVRGCPSEMDCRQVFLSGLREFEVETFPRPGKRSSPWIDPDDSHGHEGARRGRRAGARPPASVAKKALSPTELRPDLPWLADLEMPDLPVAWDHRIIAFLEFWKDDPRGRSIMATWLRDQAKYEDLIIAHLRNAQLPDDLLYVAMIESSYNPHEYSRAGASGLWQFMPAGGRIYGLTINRWIDERNDPERSTEAAMLYFQDLYQRFGNWDLALAAYNAGYGAVLHGVAKYNTNDFWQLLEYENALPWESSVYVPKALAAAIVGRNRDVFGFGEVKRAAPLRWDHVVVPGGVPLATVANAAGCDLGKILELNPQLRRKRTPPGVSKYVIRIPQGASGKFARRFEQLRGEWDGYDAYVVSHGERFEDIATAYGISRRALAELNDMDHQSELSGGLVLVVPRVSAEDKRTNAAKAADDLYSDGEPAGEPGEKLVVAVPDAKLRIKGKRLVFYRVVIGDTQWGVSNAFGVNRLDLARWNGLDPESYLQPKMVLRVFVDPKLDLAKRNIKVLDPTRIELVERGSEAHLDAAETRLGRKRVVYKAKSRETYAEVGKKYGLTARDLARINRKPFDTVLEPGDEVLVYEVVDPSRSDRAKAQAKQAKRR